MKPTVGRIVNYKLTKEDVEYIKIKRKHSRGLFKSISELFDKAEHADGNENEEGQIVPMIIVAVWSESCVNGQVFLDGNDTLWKTSASLGGGVGSWSWPVIEAPKKVEY